MFNRAILSLIFFLSLNLNGIFVLPSDSVAQKSPIELLKDYVKAHPLKSSIYTLALTGVVASVIGENLIITKYPDACPIYLKQNSFMQYYFSVAACNLNFLGNRLGKVITNAQFLSYAYVNLSLMVFVFDGVNSIIDIIDKVVGSQPKKDVNKS